MEIKNTHEIMGESFQKAQLSAEESMLVGKVITTLCDTITQKISKFKVTGQTWPISRRNQIRNDKLTKTY